MIARQESGAGLFGWVSSSNLASWLRGCIVCRTRTTDGVRRFGRWLGSGRVPLSASKLGASGASNHRTRLVVRRDPWDVELKPGGLDRELQKEGAEPRGSGSRVS